jgi:hypothetical protein
MFETRCATGVRDEALLLFAICRGVVMYSLSYLLPADAVQILQTVVAGRMPALR